MRSYTRMCCAACTALAFASCAEMRPPDSKREANARWSQMRGRLRCQLAAEHLDKGRIDEAQKHVEEAIALAPDAPAGYVLMARIMLERGETAAAGQMLAEATARGGESAEIHYLTGLVAQRYGRFDEALTRYQRACEADPMNAHYVAATAETLVALGRVGQALDLVRQRWTDFEHNATLRWLAGEIRMMTGQYEEAAEAFRQASVISREDPVLQRQLGLTLALAKRHAEGQKVLQAVVEGDSDAPASVLLALGHCHLGTGQYDQAKAVLRKVVQAHPDNPHAWRLLSQASIGSNDLLTARRAAMEAMRLDPRDPDHAVLLGYVCWLQRDYTVAVVALEERLHDEPQDMMALYILAQCHQGAGRTQDALKCAQRALQIDPQCDWAKELVNSGSARADTPDAEWLVPGGVARSP